MTVAMLDVCRLRTVISITCWSLVAMRYAAWEIPSIMGCQLKNGFPPLIVGIDSLTV